MKKNISSELREKIHPIYKKLLAQNDFKNICTFAIQWGENFPTEKNKGFLFVGKAVNGWIAGDEDVDNLFDKNNSKRIFERDNQMEWVNNNEGSKNGYNSRRSAFWRLIKKVSKTYYPQKWYSNIAWTNLYKIAPSKKGNPNNKLQIQQRKICIELLQIEINVLSPEYVIMLTSGWERSFIEEIKKRNEPNIRCIDEQEWGKYKTSLIEINKIKYIISHHPQGKKECKHKEAINSLIEIDRKIN